MTLQGKTVLITGSTSGIGAATAKLLATDGAHVIVTGLEADLGRQLTGEIRESGARADFLAADLLDARTPARLVDFAVRTTGRLDVLVNNAGANIFGGVHADLDTWQRCLDLDVRAAWLCARAADDADTGLTAIVTVASNHAHRTLPGVFPYNVAKAGALAMTQSLAIELAPRVRANAVVPGWIDTPINEGYFASDDSARERVEALHPLGRIGEAAEVARAIRFLADDAESSFVTGTALTVDGGRSALLQDPAR